MENHAAQLTQAHMTALQERLGIAAGHEWDGFDASEPIAQWLQQLDHKHHIDTDAVLTAMGQVLFGNRS